MLTQPSLPTDLYAHDRRTSVGFYLARLPRDPATGKLSFPRLDAKTLTYSQFIKNHLIPNLPAVISSELTSVWRARLEWVIDATLGDSETSPRPDLDRIQDLFGHARADVADCQTRWFSDQQKSEMSVREFVECWRRKIQAQDQDGDVWLGYLKDWHFVRDFGAYQAYQVPEIFKDDWLNLWYDSREDTNDDYRFVYMGCKGTWTPFHADVLRSYSWSSNICGRKRWLFFPPGQECLFTDSFGEHVYSVDSPIDSQRFPRFHEAVSIEVIQETGETVFVPSGWFHQVWNLEDTISINHNWANSFNWDFVVQSVLSELARIEKSIEHVRGSMSDPEWEDHCQLMLRTLAGIDLAGIREWARVVAEIKGIELGEAEQEVIATLGDLQDFDGGDSAFAALVQRFERSVLRRTMQS